ncbi:MAG: hypothetical protein LC737_03630, partial [Chloroflexi bacterium]|nr:hypothetical protein [Chloroflexota bacterium]
MNTEGRRQSVATRRRLEFRRPSSTGRRQFGIAFLLLLLCIPALIPMLGVTFWQSHDGLHHIFRLANFDATLRSGVLFPRWADALGFGYGYPVTNYYAPLAYYLADFFHLFGTGFLDSIKLTYALGFAMSAFGAYRLARDVVSAPAALLAAAAFVYYPYHIADAYMRGTLTEFMALSLLPLMLWLVRRSLLTETRRRQLWFALSAAGCISALIMLHNLSAFLALPMVVLYG